MFWRGWRTSEMTVLESIVGFTWTCVHPLRRMRSMSLNMVWTSSTWILTMSQNPTRSLGMMGNGSASSRSYKHTNKIQILGHDGERVGLISLLQTQKLRLNLWFTVPALTGYKLPFNCGACRRTSWFYHPISQNSSLSRDYVGGLLCGKKELTFLWTKIWQMQRQFTEETCCQETFPASLKHCLLKKVTSKILPNVRRTGGVALSHVILSLQWMK